MLFWYFKILLFFFFQNESVQSKTIEISNLRDKITSLEAALSSVSEEKVQNEVQWKWFFLSTHLLMDIGFKNMLVISLNEIYILRSQLASVVTSYKSNKI